MKQYKHGGEIYDKDIALDYSINVNPFGMPDSVKKALLHHMEEYVKYPDDSCYELRRKIAEANSHETGAEDGCGEGALVREISEMEAVNRSSQCNAECSANGVQAVTSASQSTALTPEMVLCGNGAADIIYRLCLAAAPTKAMVLAPTFSEYEQALRMVKSDVVYYELSRENGFSVDEGILERLKEEFASKEHENREFGDNELRKKEFGNKEFENKELNGSGTGRDPGSYLLFLCNPNNPVGNLIPPEVMEKILVLCSKLGVLVVVDECFMEFTEYQATHSVVPKLSSFPNLMVIKAFTKTYAMAGLRLGYALSADASLLASMKASGPPWAVSTPAQVAGMAALSEGAYVAGAREYIARERAFLADELTKMGYQVYESYTNYLLFEEPEGTDISTTAHACNTVATSGEAHTCSKPDTASVAHISLYVAMLAEKILLRQCGNYHGLGDSFYRITVGLHEDNVALIETMKRVSSTLYYRSKTLR